MTTPGHVPWTRWNDEHRDLSDDGWVNGRPAKPWEADIVTRARAAALAGETARLFNGVNPKFNTDNGAKSK